MYAAVAKNIGNFREVEILLADHHLRVFDLLRLIISNNAHADFFLKQSYEVGLADIQMITDLIECNMIPQVILHVFDRSFDEFILDTLLSR